MELKRMAKAWLCLLLLALAQGLRADFWNDLAGAVIDKAFEGQKKKPESKGGGDAKEPQEEAEKAEVCPEAKDEFWLEKELARLNVAKLKGGEIHVFTLCRYHCAKERKQFSLAPKSLKGLLAEPYQGLNLVALTLVGTDGCFMVRNVGCAWGVTENPYEHRAGQKDAFMKVGKEPLMAMVDGLHSGPMKWPADTQGKQKASKERLGKEADEVLESLAVETVQAAMLYADDKALRKDYPALFGKWQNVQDSSETLEFKEQSVVMKRADGKEGVAWTFKFLTRIYLAVQTPGFWDFRDFSIEDDGEAIGLFPTNGGRTLYFKKISS